MCFISFPRLKDIPCPSGPRLAPYVLCIILHILIHLCTYIAKKTHRVQALLNVFMSEHGGQCAQKTLRGGGVGENFYLAVVV